MPSKTGPLKIGIIAHLEHVLREPYAGGLEMHTMFLAQALNRRGHEATVFAAGDGEALPGVEVIAQETNPDKSDDCFGYRHAAYLALMRRLKNADFDILHNNSLHYLPVAMAHQLPLPMI